MTLKSEEEIVAAKKEATAQIAAQIAEEKAEGEKRKADMNKYQKVRELIFQNHLLILVWVLKE